MSLRVCAYARCPKLVQPNERYCNEHKRAVDVKRGTREQRGYGMPHKRMRAQWASRINAGEKPICPRCHQPIIAGQSWHLDHADDRENYLGPAHSHCNTSAGQKHSIQMRERWNN